MSVRNIWVSLVNQVYGLLGLAHGGTNVDLSATGGTSQVLKQVTAGAAITVGQLAAADLSNGVTGSGAVMLSANSVTSQVYFGSTSGFGINIEGGNLTFRDHTASNDVWFMSVVPVGSGGGIAMFGGGNEAANPTLNVQGTVNASAGFKVGGSQIAASNLSNGTTGSGAVVLSSGTGVSVGPGAPISITTVGGIVTALTVTSDERLKDFKLYTGGLDEILAINPIRYKWNERGKEVAQRPDDDDREYVGFGAQDVQKAIPEAIVGQQIAPDGTTYLGFDDRPVIAAMVNAIKELTARVKELEAKNVSA